MSSQWQQFVQLYREKNPRASMNQVKQSFDKLKRVYSQKGGFNNIDLANANLRYAAGVTPLNSGIAELSTLHKGGFNNIDLADPQLRYAAGVTPLNSGIAELPRGGQSGGRKRRQKQRGGSLERDLLEKIKEFKQNKNNVTKITINKYSDYYISKTLSNITINDNFVMFRILKDFQNIFLSDPIISITKNTMSADTMLIDNKETKLYNYNIQL